jgi:hypothetical protein
MVQAAVGDNDAARETFSEIVPQAKGLPPSMESALVRDAARFQAQRATAGRAGNL